MIVKPCWFNPNNVFYIISACFLLLFCGYCFKNVTFALLKERYSVLDKHTEFELFFKENYSRFYCFALQLISDEEVCRDIVGDAFEYAWRGYHKESISNWKSYIYSYIRNKCVDHIRHQMVEEKYADFCLQLYKEEEEDGYEVMDERIAAMRRILSELPPKTRLVLQQCYIHKKKYSEVADELGVSISAVRKHIVKALKTLREGIDKKSK